jgi:pimeloyl-ACP methyl ester carboxylesterase
LVSQHEAVGKRRDESTQVGGELKTVTSECREEKVKIGGTELVCLRGGKGPPLLILHEELGHPGWLNWHSALAREHELFIPLQPGFGKSDKLDWILNMRDLAGFYSRCVRTMNLVPVDVLGFSTGGWIAAEMAAQNAQQLRRMMLVAPAGVRPSDGEIFDMFAVTARTYLSATVLDPDTTPEFNKLYGGERTPEQFEAFEDARAETARLAWEPYLYDPSLTHLLEGVFGLPTLFLWGREDKVIPLNAGELYKAALNGSRLIVLDKCGHRPEIEKTDSFVDIARDFFA